MTRDDVAKIDELCPFDGAAPFEPVTSPGLVGCPTDGCPLHYVYITREQWNRRAISSALSAQGMPEVAMPAPDTVAGWVYLNEAGNRSNGYTVWGSHRPDERASWRPIYDHVQSLQAKINATAQEPVTQSGDPLGAQSGSIPDVGGSTPSPAAAAPLSARHRAIASGNFPRCPHLGGCQYPEECSDTCKLADLPHFAPSDRKQEAGLVERVINFDSSSAQSVQIDLCALAARDEEIAGLRGENERLVKMEQDRLLMASEDEIRRELLNDGRDPEQYLRAVDTSMKCAGDNALLTHELAELRAKLAEADLGIAALHSLVTLKRVKRRMEDGTATDGERAHYEGSKEEAWLYAERAIDAIDAAREAGK